MALFNPNPQAQVPHQAKPQGGGFLQQLLAPENAMPIAAALMGQGGNGQNFSNAMGAYGQQAAQTAGKNKTMDFFRKQAPEYAQMVEAGMPVETAWQTYTKQRYAQQADPYLSVGGKIFNKQDQSWMSPPEDPNASPETGLVPQMMRDPETGQTIYVQPTKDGRLIKSAVPDGYQPYDPYEKAYQTKKGATVGEFEGDAQASFGAKAAGIDDSIRLVDEIVVNPNLESSVGPIDGRLPSFRAGARDFDMRVEQLKGKAFMQARAELKGGGQITDYEGARAEAALVRATQAVDEASFRQAMSEFRDSLQRGKQLLAQQAGTAGQGGPQGMPAPAGDGLLRTQTGATWRVK